MNSDNNRNSVSTNEKLTSHRKRKRRRWKKCMFSNKDDFSYYAGTFKHKNSSSWFIGPTWYWSNYKKALEWQSKIKVELWKSYVQQENPTLAVKLRRKFPDGNLGLPLTFLNLEHAVHAVSRGMISMMDDLKNDMELEQESFENEGIEFEMSDEMKKFFEESIKHKMEMKRLKEKEEEEGEYNCINLQMEKILETHGKREKEMKLLYGDSSSMIIGMETAVQLSFDKYCDLKSPKYWPNLPLKL